jgi:hypothetical protein
VKFVNPANVPKGNFTYLYFELQHPPQGHFNYNSTMWKGKQVGMASIDIIHMRSFHGQKYLMFKMASVINLEKKHNLF